MKTPTHPCSKPAVLVSLLTAAFLLSALRVQAQANASPPGFMTYQGYLVDANGNALGTNAPKNYDVIFRIWDAATGGATALWAEQQTVTVDKGYFSVLLGEGSSIGEPRPALNTLFTTATASDRWVGLTVKGIGAGGADANILPRLRMLASPYSFLAQKAITASTVDGSALTSGTVPDARLSANVALRAGGNNFTGNQFFGNGDLFLDNQRILAARNASGAYENVFWPRWSDNVTYLNYGSGGFEIRNNASASKMFFSNSGNVGIGTTAPGFPLNFASTMGDKIALWGNGGNHYGFGIQSGLLQIHAAAAADDIAFGYGSSASMTERMRIKGNGDVGIGTDSPTSRLHVSGGDLKIEGGTLYVDNSQYLYAKNAAGVYEGFMVPRWGDNVTYMNYGSGGFNIRNNAGATAMWMANNGFVGIGTQGPWAPLTVQYDNVPGVVVQRSDGRYGWLYRNNGGAGSGGTVGIQLNQSHWSSGDRAATFDGDNNWDFGSDRRLKKDIVDVEPVLERALQVQVRRYRWKDSPAESKHMLGVIAQELQPLFPDMVSEYENPTTKEKNLTVGYGDFAVIAIKALQELKQQQDAELAKLKTQLADLTRENQALAAENEARDKRLAAIEQILRDKLPQPQSVSGK